MEKDSGREYFQQVRLGYAVNAANYKNEQEYILNATEKPFALVAISRKFGDELFVNWLLPTVIPVRPSNPGNGREHGLF